MSNYYTLVQVRAGGARYYNFELFTRCNCVLSKPKNKHKKKRKKKQKTCNTQPKTNAKQQLKIAIVQTKYKVYIHMCVYTHCLSIHSHSISAAHTRTCNSATAQRAPLAFDFQLSMFGWTLAHCHSCCSLNAVIVIRVVVVVYCCILKLL